MPSLNARMSIQTPPMTMAMTPANATKLSSACMARS